MTNWNYQFGVPQQAKFRLGDPVVCTQNLWNLNLQNGTLGRIVEVGGVTGNDRNPNFSHEKYGADTRLGAIRWDNGSVMPVTVFLLEHLDLAYSITVHKSQGSQFHRVILPVTSSRIMDRTLLYTAVTRAQNQMIMVGDEDAAKNAVISLPKAHLRQVSLSQVLQEENRGEFSWTT
jgi:exodeoxyribonuclease V alpha subunit